MIRLLKPALLALGLHAMTAAHAQLPPAWREALSSREPARVATLLREAGGRLPVDARGHTVLHWAPRYEAERDAAPMFDLLVASGADIHAVAQGGLTPLHMAAAYDCAPCVRKLLQAGANTSVQRDDGGTPLHRAGARTQALLIAAGADVNARDRRGRTPLHTAAQLTEPLLAAGVNVTDRSGFTPLHFAALAGASETIEWLLARGADPALQSTALFEHREGVLAAQIDPVYRFEPGQRPYDLAKWQHDRTKWSTGRYSRAVELLERVTPRRGMFSR